MEKTPLILVDGSSYLFRAYHAMPPLTNSQGKPTGALLGVLNMLRKLLNDYQPEHIAVVFDPKGKTTRHALYEDYKANRPIMPEELQQQIAPLHDMIRAMGIPLLIETGIEADDIIGTLAMRASAAGQDTLISTGDKDMAQLVNTHISLINTMTNTHLDVVGVNEKFGVPPEKIIDYLTLVGDSVDNVPGVPGVGPKTAIKWLKEWGSLETILTNAHQIPGKVGENLRSVLAQLPLSKTLVTIDTQLDLPYQADDLQRYPQDTTRLIDDCRRFELKSWLAELLNQTTPTSATTHSANYTAITTTDAFQVLLTRLEHTSLLCLDTETDSLHIAEANLIGLSLSFEVHEAFYIPLGHDEGEQLDRTLVLNALKPYFENPKVEKIGQNLKFDRNVLLNQGIDLQGILFDTMLESYVFDSNQNRHDLDSLAAKYLDYKTQTFEELAGKGVKQKTFNQIDIASATHYAAEDADITLQLHRKLFPLISEEKSLLFVLTNIEIPLVPVLADIERQGVLLDLEKLSQQNTDLGIAIQRLEEEAYRVAGQVFNLASPKQLQELLYGKLGLPVLEKTPTGQASTAESVLQELANDFVLPKIILDYRSLSKLKSTYTEALPLQVHPKTGRVHTSYHQAVTATGRLSSSDPNLQNIPVRTPEGRRIRQAFIAKPGSLLVSADYSQIELRIMAHLSQDETLCRAFAENIDVHRVTAAEVAGISLAEVTSEQRRHAKAVNFGLIYGMSAFGLAKQLSIPRETAQLYIDRYFQRYPGVKAYMDRTRALARSQGYVETVYGRRLHLSEINSRHRARQMGAERAAINAPMQGTAADIIKRAMIAIHHWLHIEKLPATMIMQVHDELVFEVTESSRDELMAGIKQHMTAAGGLNIPLVVDIGYGQNWDEAH